VTSPRALGKIPRPVQARTLAVPTSRGAGEWSAMQVQRVLDRLD
jgi:hypothetical protein